MGRSLFSTVYFIIGIFVAVTYGYFSLGSISQIISFVLAIILWPLVFFGVNLHINFGF